MNFFVLLFSLGTFFSAFSKECETIIIKYLEKDEILYEKGDLDQQISPCSTFKIVLSLMGFDFGILQDEFHPQWTYNEKEYKTSNVLWRSAHYPQNWMKDSCVWFSKELVKRLGFENFKNYISLLHYGNEEIFGDLGTVDGFLHCWLSSSLKISPLQQICFLQRLLTKKLPVNGYAQEMTKKILFLEEINGYQLFGKSGTGFQNGGNQMGWFVGWVKKIEKTLAFAILIQDEKNNEISAGARARERIKQLFFSENFFE